MSSQQIVYCCKSLKMHHEKEGFPLFYEKTKRYFGMLAQGSSCFQLVSFCPFCGYQFPSDVIHAFYRTLEREYGIAQDDIKENGQNLPEEFKSDIWWKKRKF